MIYITGDMHGDIARFKASALRKLKRNDYLIICGDFGFIWDGSPEEAAKLKKLSKKKYTILFVDGPNENFSLLEQYPEETWNGGKVHRITDNLFHLMRGEIFTIEGSTFFAFGGGEAPVSVYDTDSNVRWSRESPNIEEMKSGIENLKKYHYQVDYIITHTPCLGVGTFKTKFEETILDVYFGKIEKLVAHRQWFFGSLHMDRRYTSKRICVFENVLPLTPVSVDAK